jgi:hypothetical protein
MRAKGFLPKPLGAVSDAAILEARALYARWLIVKAAPARISTWPSGTLGYFFDGMRRTAKWAKKKPRTREDYDRAAPHLQELFARPLRRITVDDCERLADDLQARLGPHERYRTIKVLRAVFADAIYRLKLVGYPSPAKGFANPQPKGRGAIWLGAEIPRLIAAAEALGYGGMALAIAIAWDTLFSPVDVWGVTKGEIHKDGAGAWIDRDRVKTGKAAFGYLSPATARSVDLYVNTLPFELAPESPVIRQRNGHAYRSKDTFGDDFRAVRAAAFGPAETRQFQDLRRSGNVEADAAGASKADMAQILANTLDASAFLDETYTPPTVAKARQVAQLRLEGRKRLAGEVTRSKRP